MNEKRFDNKGTVYAKARPDYTNEIFDYLLKRNIINSNTIVSDIGAGTGIFTIQLSPYVKNVFAVEPNGDMRSIAECKLKSANNTVLINGTAENTSLDSNSVDLITVAQAFHWFDRALFKNECRRILKPEGKVLLIWNDRDSRSEIIKDNFAVNRTFCPEFKGSSNGFDFSKEAFSDFFDGDFDVLEFNYNLLYDSDAFILRNLSSSYAPKPQDSIYIEYVEQIKAVFNKHCINGSVKYPYITRCYIGNV